MKRYLVTALALAAIGSTSAIASPESNGISLNGMRMNGMRMNGVLTNGAAGQTGLQCSTTESIAKQDSPSEGYGDKWHADVGGDVWSSLALDGATVKLPAEHP